MLHSQDPFVRQFVHAQPDGPVAFQYPSSIPYLDELNVKAA
jgi:phospholipid/cholesterol/gamma-HCH transport system ATP-binding protein